jgi:uncharacterized delta-60 repeat protein
MESHPRSCEERCVMERSRIEAPLRGGQMIRLDLVRRGLVVSSHAGLLVLVLISAATAAAGDLDATFGGNGKVTTGFGGDSRGHAVAIQMDGKIVVAGEAPRSPVSSKFAVTRYDPDGTLDHTFGGDGKVTTSFGAHSDAFGVAIQGDDKILVAGRAVEEGTSVFALTRYKPGGGLDDSFSGDGKVTTGFEDRPTVGRGVAIQPDGKIVVVGIVSSTPPGDDRFAVVRYTPNGVIDDSFGGDGKVTTRIGEQAGASSVAIQPNGRIVAAGFMQKPGFGQVMFALARYMSNGALDDSFGGNGKLRTGFGGPSAGATADGVSLYPDGKIVAAGGLFIDDDTHKFAVARYTPRGALDDSFDENGKVITGFGDRVAFANDVAVQPDNRIVAAGELRLPSFERKFALTRYRPNGALDDTFGGDGKVTTRFGAEESVALASGVAIQPDGKIVAAGTAFDEDFDGRFAVARYLAV